MNNYQGYLSVYVYSAEKAIPVSGAKVYIRLSSSNTPGFDRQSASGIPFADYELQTDESGITQGTNIASPNPMLALNEFSEEVPYALCDVFVRAAGYLDAQINGVQIFAENMSYLPVAMLTFENAFSDGALMNYNIPPNTLRTPEIKVQSFAPGVLRAVPNVLEEVVIPETITVHLGRPDQEAPNVLCPFTDYIKNVACSEIYPSWPEDALRANIYAIISLTLNRVFTEWYPSKGYDFQITNSTAYDQSFVPGRNIFENISRIVDEVFNIYIRREGFVDPLFAQYCDGREVNCDGLSQWGTVSLAQNGYSAFRILEYYYGNDIEFASAQEIAPFTESYPGTPLRYGSVGEDVRTIQIELNRIGRNYPLIPKILVENSRFGAETDAAVRTFQSIFNLAVDGIVGKATWYAISRIYVAVARLAELSSEGRRNYFTYSIPTETLSLGDRGKNVQLLQYLLSIISLYYSTMTSVNVDGVFGSATEESVKRFQSTFSLTPDGVVGSTTWNKLYEVYDSLTYQIVQFSPEQEFAGTELSLGSSGEEVSKLQTYLSYISRFNPSIPQVNTDGYFGQETENAVRSFQQRFGLSGVTGRVDRITWDSIVAFYNLLRRSEERNQTVSAFASEKQRELRYGMSGEKVLALQRKLNRIKYLPHINESPYYGYSTYASVSLFQKINHLEATGNADSATMDMIEREIQ